MGVPVRGCVFLFVALLVAGCSRTWYREQADADAYRLEVSHVPSQVAPIGRIDITPNPSSRLADPYDPDRPPKPPDDPAAAFIMDRPGGMKGYSHWGKYGCLDAIESPNWQDSLGLENGVLKLTQDRSVEIALMNSREFQTGLEDVYLQALTLSLTLFDFECQWFGRAGVDYLRTGASSLPAESNLLTNTSQLGFRRNFAAGGQLLVDFANSFVWEFTGRTSSVGGSISAQFVQPLLRGFARNVRLEVLTQTERDTLYAVRNFARFRKRFWADIAVTGDGYLNLLLQIQSIRNAGANLKSQEENYRLNIELFRGNKRSVVEVDQALQGVLEARQQILDAEIGLQNSLDSFKRRLGLPPVLAVELDDSLLEQFVLVDPAVERLRGDVDAFDLARKAELDNVPPADALKLHFAELLTLLGRMTYAVDSAEYDLKQWKTIQENPLSDLDPENKLRAEETYRQNSAVPSESRKEVGKLAARIREHQAGVTDANRLASWQSLMQDVRRLFSLLDEVITAQTMARIYRLELPHVEYGEAAAIGYAKENRLDFQNSKAQVTDAWRKMEVAANSLRSDLNVNVGFTAAAAPGSNNPFNFANDSSRLRGGVQFDGPLNRMAERNAYRASQISYERARRRYMEISDGIEQEIRTSLRSLKQTRVSFEIARQSLIAAARQVENERILLVQPVPPQGGNTGDAALRTLRALQSLNIARDRLAATFISYEQQRVQLLLNLEELQLDDRGFPINATVRTSTPPPGQAPSP